MGTSSVATTRSIAIGLLLAFVSAGSLVMFSYVAGSADDVPLNPVRASRPDTKVAPVVLGSQVAETKPGRERARAEQSRPDRSADDEAPLVLGTRFSQPSEPEPPRDKGSKPGSEVTRTDPSAPPVARKVPTAPCDCKSKKEHTPNGNAYGYHRTRSGGGSPGASEESNGGHGSQGSSKSSSSGNGNAYGHDKGNGQGKGKPH